MTPEDVKNLPEVELPALARRVRERILETVAANGGHLAASLGTVELTIGLLRMFDPPADKVLWDVGHQSYAWKILTGREDEFGRLRRHHGLSGFPNPAESPCDAFVAGHAGSALAAAVGLAAARDRLGGGHVVAVVGDASLTNGESLEALNNCTSLTEKMIVVVNDNAMSISKNVGAFARTLGRLLADVRYNRAKAAAERAGHRMRLTFLRSAYHRAERMLKSFWLTNSLFESLGLRYIGPVDGHDLKAVVSALTVAKEDKRSVVVHVVTKKGKGFPPAEANPSVWHGVGPFDLKADRFASGAGDGRHLMPGMPSAGGSVSQTWSDCFGKAMVEAARRDDKVCAVVAAMKDGTGLSAFAEEFPDRFFDVGICEGMAVTFAAGLARAGMKPVVAIYSTFLQRAIDQIQHDVCLQRLPVVFAVDRAGCVGADGATHHGLYDIPLLRPLTGMRIVAPTCAEEMKELLGEALSAYGPTAIRFSKGVAPLRKEAVGGGLHSLSLTPPAAGDEVQMPNCTLPAAGDRPGSGTPGDRPEVSGATPLAQSATEDKLPIANRKLPIIYAVGDQVAKAVKVRELLSARGIVADVVPVSRIKPALVCNGAASEKISLAEQERMGDGQDEPIPEVCTGGRNGREQMGGGHEVPIPEVCTGGRSERQRMESAMGRGAADGRLMVTLENGVVAGGYGESVGADIKFGWPDAVVGHGTVDELEREFGFDAESVASAIMERMIRNG